MPRAPRSFRLTPKATAALDWLRAQPGGLDLTHLINTQIIQLATKRGWREEQKLERP